MSLLKVNSCAVWRVRRCVANALEILLGTFGRKATVFHSNCLRNGSGAEDLFEGVKFPARLPILATPT